MIPGLHDEPTPRERLIRALTQAEDQRLVEALGGEAAMEHATTLHGQIPCGVPHTYLYVDGNRCGRCGAQV